LRIIPGMVIMAPKDEAELRNMVYTAVEHCEGPVAVRYPRGSALGVKLEPGFNKIEIGKAEKLTDGEDIAILAVGSMVNYAEKAVAVLKESGINAELINMRFIKPLDEQLLDQVALKHDKIVTLEENNLPGGFGSAIVEYFIDKNYKNDILRIGIPDKFIDHGTQAELHKQISIDPLGIVAQISSFLKNTKSAEKVSY
ncbi:MAG: dxs, partial [Ignavibacteriaceae bacterium]|nr:dxs [Ignavibacteriaceae bacterium]